MTNELRYSEKLTMAEYRIACCDELNLEALVFEEEARMLASDDPQGSLGWRYLDADKFALREIDRLKLSGEYEAERGRLAAFVDPPSGARLRVSERAKAGEFTPFQNFLDGLKSPDLEQRERFEQLYCKEELADKCPGDFWHILVCLEQAKKHGGRPRVSPPWRNAAASLDAMRVAVVAGAPIAQAAREAAEREAEDRGRGQGANQNRAGYFEKLYRQRAAMRG